MESIREQLIRKFESWTRKRDAEETLGDAVYALLRCARELDLCVDGWTVFRVMRESTDSIEAVGLMMLLPDGSIPMAVSLRTTSNGITWSVQVGEQNQD